jgi:histidinol dehydrogenase
MSKILRLNSSDKDFNSSLNKLLAWDDQLDANVHSVVKNVLNDIKRNGDKALISYTQKFDGLSVNHASELEIPKAQLLAALENLPSDQRTALEASAKRVLDYHQRQLQPSWDFTETDGTKLGQRVTPIDRAGLYVPGGKAAYPSSVLMNAIPAKVAGVEEVIMVVPTPKGELNELVLAAAAISGVDRVFTIGGAQAIAALAYGTETIPAVDKIVGPGNIYVATAKREVFGTVGIDMIAGPSEILVICDGETDPDWIAMDLFSQAEHDENAQSILISPSAEYLDKVEQSIIKLLPSMERKEIITASLYSRAAFIKVDSLAQAAEISNFIAPEHLELSIEDPESLLPSIKHAGAIFMGRYTAEALGDYCAGPNHVLPTSRTARFSSPLGVYDFQKRSSILYFSETGASETGKIASIMARGEGLTAHARSAEYRIKK